MSRKSEVISKLNDGGLSTDEVDLYFRTLSQFLSAKMSKLEYESSMSELLPTRNRAHVHNEIITEILRRAQEKREGVPELPRLVPVRERRSGSRDGRGRRGTRDIASRVGGKRKRNEDFLGINASGLIGLEGGGHEESRFGPLQPKKRIKKGILGRFGGIDGLEIDGTILLNEGIQSPSNSFSRRRRPHSGGRVKRGPRGSKEARSHLEPILSNPFVGTGVVNRTSSAIRQSRALQSNSRSGFLADPLTSRQQHESGQFLQQVNGENGAHEGIIRASAGSSSVTTSVIRPYSANYLDFLTYPFHPTDASKSLDVRLFSLLKRRLEPICKENGVTEIQNEAITLLIKAIEERVRSLFQIAVRNATNRRGRAGRILFEKDSDKRGLGVVRALDVSRPMRKHSRLAGNDLVALERLLLG